MINTNGVRLANDDELVQKLSDRRDRLEIYFQFDSMHDDQIAKLRGQEGLLETKLRALDKLAAAKLNVTLVATLQGGVNNDAPSELVEFARKRPEVTGLSFQPATYSGRYALPDELEQRITFPDVVDTIVDDSRNAFDQSDFFPLPCAHPNCHWIALAARDQEAFIPLTKLVDAREHLDLLANGISFTRERTQALAKTGGGSTGVRRFGVLQSSHRIKRASCSFSGRMLHVYSRSVSRRAVLRRRDEAIRRGSRYVAHHNYIVFGCLQF